MTSKTYLRLEGRVHIDGLGPSLLERFDLTGEVGVPGLKVEVGRRQIDRGRFARAERLCAALEDQEGVGAIDDKDSPFVRGTLLMVWGFFNRGDARYADVVFSGFRDRSTFMGLGGSAYHTMERAGDRLQQFSNSGIQGLMAFLKERSEAGQSPLRRDPPDAWPAEAWEADHDNPTVPERVEFVAERLLDGRRNGIRHIIGSPIYVARTGEPLTPRAQKEYEALRNDVAIRINRKPRLKRRHGGWEIGKPSSPKPIPVDGPSTRNGE